MREDPHICFEVRFLEELFVFTKSHCLEKTIHRLKEKLDMELVDVFGHDTKIYVIPKSLTKGEAIRRFREKITKDTYIIAAGDSVFDVSMFAQADLSFAPETLKTDIPAELLSQVSCLPPLFSEECLQQVLKVISLSESENKE